MVTRWDARTQATSTAREKPSHECSNYATKEPKFDYFKSHLDLQMQAASAWVAAAEGKKNEAVDMLRRAADSEDILGKHPVSPGAFVPIREQLGSLLLEVGQS